MSQKKIKKLRKVFDSGEGEFLKKKITLKKISVFKNGKRYRAYEAHNPYNRAFRVIKKLLKKGE